MVAVSPSDPRCHRCVPARRSASVNLRDRSDASATPSGDARAYLGVLRRRWPLVVATAAVAALVALSISLLQTPMYRSSSVISVNPVLSPSGRQVASAQVGSSFVQAQLDLLRSQTAADLVAEQIGGPVRASFSSFSAGTANILIEATSPDPVRAALVADTYVGVYEQLRIAEDLERVGEAAAVVSGRLGEVEDELAALEAETGDDPRRSVREQELIGQRNQYEQQLRVLADEAAFIESGRISVIDPALVPSEPYEPTVARNLTLAVLIGLVLGLFAAFARDYFDDAVGSSDSMVDAVGGLPLMGAIPRDESWSSASDTRLASVESPNSVVAEAYRTLRTSLQFGWIDEPRKIVQVTSSRSFEGKSTTVANLGVALAASGSRVLVLDLDLRRPRIQEFFGLTNDIGFTSVLKDPDSLETATAVSARITGLEVLTSGPKPSNPSELLSSPEVATLLTRLRETYDVIVVDSPPVLGVSDPLVIAGLVDATLLVARSGSTTKSEVWATAELLRKVHAPLVGSVVNFIDRRYQRYYGYYGYYGYAAEYLGDGVAVGRNGHGSPAVNGNGHDVEGAPDAPREALAAVGTTPVPAEATKQRGRFGRKRRT